MNGEIYDSFEKYNFKKISTHLLARIVYLTHKSIIFICF
ncbi:conserved hypothetical protein [Leptospira interrogans serovar Manilae]|nr:hypothetical protein LEP1GSC037_0034 [Leptospira interrogans str. 2006001854]EMN72401.1 hypothetical protein LEP1GSC100_0080 [Leptospira interrogans serovar Bataviae str. UI 08561]EMY05125.1 hypothetical protein LEP1GSC029_4247 [Leptospira interrogans str. 2002000626]SOR60365.1 conserved hypothetical protein [Leptospira interrogans serovar Manilae]